MALGVLFFRTLLPILLVLGVQHNLFGALAFTPPRPQDSHGFEIQLDGPHGQKSQTTLSAVQNMATINVSDTREFAYLVQMAIGGQSFSFTLDTASSDLWVACSNCTDADCQAVETYVKTPTLALSQIPFNLKYVQGNVSGIVGYETVTFGPVEVYGQVFGMVTNVTSINLSGTHNSGILGLSFPKSSSIRRRSGKTLLENVYDGLPENNRFFAFKLGRAGEPSSFAIGQVDPTLLSGAPLAYFPVYPASIAHGTYDYWKLPLHRINIDGFPLPFPLSRSRVQGSPLPIAVLDTGTSLMLGPTHDVDLFWQTVGGARRDDATGFWMVRCDRAINASVVFGGTDGVETREYSIHPRDLSWNGTQSGDMCLGGIQGNNKVIAGDWLLGDVFLRNVYATHHAATSSMPPLIGLANLTDPVSAMMSFQAERGKDSSGPIILSVKAERSRTPVLLLSAAAGFSSGLLVMFALKGRAFRRIGKKRLFF